LKIHKINLTYHPIQKVKIIIMSLPVNNKNSGKPGSKGAKGGLQGSKFIAKPNAAKPMGGGKKPIKTGGSRGS